LTTIPRGDYNRGSYLKQRAPILQAWADQLTKWGMVLPSSPHVAPELVVDAARKGHKGNTAA
jgi:hypothetical protein